MKCTLYSGIKPVMTELGAAALSKHNMNFMRSWSQRRRVMYSNNTNIT